MPTFDFSNIVKKIISLAVQASCSPIVVVLASATVIHSIVGNFTQWFSSISISNLLSKYQLSTEIFQSDLLSLFLYAIAWDETAEVINFVLSAFGSLLDFIITFSISLVGALIPLGVALVLRKSLKDWQ